MGRVAWLSASVLLVLSQVNAQGAPASSPSSAEDIVMKDLIVLCPINATMEVQSLSIQSMEPTDTTTQTNTEYASYLYTSVNALGGLTTCTSTESPIAAGSTTALPGDSGSYVIYQNNNTLLVSAGGHNESIDVPSGATVTACTAGQTYAINVYSGSNIESQDAGYYNGMTSTFFADVYPADSTSKDDFPLDFSGAGNFTRCDCPNQKAINSSWPGTPSLPVTSTFNFTNNFGVVMTGEFLVERPQDGVTGETAALFPTASDYHLVCLQHDDSASMVIDGTNYYSSDSATFEIAGYKQYCVPITMAPGWHNLTLTYGNTPLDLYSVFRFFVINADAVSVVTNNGTQSYEITWDGEGTCCTGSSTDSCVSPLDCCKFRGTTPCSGAAAPSPAIALTPVATQAVTSPGSSITPSPTTGAASPSPTTGASPVPASSPVNARSPPPPPPPTGTTSNLAPDTTSSSLSPSPVASPVASPTPITGASPSASPVASPSSGVTTSSASVASPVTTGSPSPSPANTDQSVGSSPGVPALTLPPTPTAEPTTVATPAPTTAASPAPTTAGSIASPASSPVSVPSPVATSPASPVTVSSPTTAASPVTHSSPAATPGPTNILNGYVGRPTANPSPVTSPTTVSSPVPTPSPTTAASGLPSSNDTFSISQTTGTSPSAAAPGTSATEVPVSTATAVTGGGVPSPAVADLPDGVTQQTCQQFQSACVSSESTAAPFEFTVTLTCNASSSSQVSYNSSLVYTEGASTGWAAVVPATGTLSLDQAASFTIEITPAKADTGYSTVYLALMQTYASDAAAQTLMGTVQISYFNFGTTSVNFTSIVPSGDGTANVSATVGVDFTAPSGFSVPMSGAITTDASNVSTACAAAAPSSIVGSTSMYTCEASVPIKDAYECLQTSFAFDANFSAALPASPQCGAFSATGNTSYCQQPVCQIYSVDMAFCGQEGLVTDQSQALLVMVCTQEVNVCLDCFTVTGPSNATVQYFNYAQNSTSSYQLLVQWDEAYRGNVTVDLQTNRDESYCNLDLTDPVCGYTTVAPVDALSFMVQDNVQVKAVAYKILYDCDGGQCSYTS
ncbi:hypothetical protein WJX79_001031 [Trebouxia sp. C0005]